MLNNPAYDGARSLCETGGLVAAWLNVVQALRFRRALLGRRLRSVKDPLRAAYAARRLPAHSRIRVVLAGRALTRPLAARTAAKMGRNPRFACKRDQPRPDG